MSGELNGGIHSPIGLTPAQKLARLKPDAERLIRAGVAAIERDEATWNQTSFCTPSTESLCKTTFCFAGHVLNQAGMVNSHGCLVDPTPYTSRHVLPGQCFEEAAAILLGLDAYGVEDLFYYMTAYTDEGSRNVTVQDLKDRITAVTGVMF